MTAGRAADRLGATDEAQLDVVERLLTAFAQHALQRLADPAGAAEIDADMHADGFATVAAGEPPIVDRLVDGRAAVPGRGRRIGAVSRFGGKGIKNVADVNTVTLASAATRTVAKAQLFEHATIADTIAASTRRTASTVFSETLDRGGRGTPPAPAPPAKPREPAPPAEPTVRSAPRPAPTRYVPSDPYLALRGAGRSLRHGGDGRWSSDGKLLVRHPGQLGKGWRGVLRAADVLPALPSGAIPPEATALAREAVCVSPHLSSWLARLAAGRSGAAPDAAGPVAKAYAARIDAEHLLRYDVSGAYSTVATTTAAAQPVVDAVWRPGDAKADATKLSAAIRVHSLWDGVEPSPVGVTAWAQPWAPIWLEFTVDVHSTAASDETARAWTLSQTDLVPGEGTDPAAAPAVRTVSSRVPLTTGVAAALGGAVAAYVSDEAKRDTKGVGEIDDTMSDRLALLGEVAGSPDLLGAALDGVRNRLLGLPARSVTAKAADGTSLKPAPDGLPQLLAAGMAKLTAVRVLDAFGRVLDARSRDRDGAAAPDRAGRAGCAAAAAALHRAGTRADCGWSVPRRSDPGTRSTRSSTRPSRRRWSTRWPASCCPTTSTSPSRSSRPTARRSASCSPAARRTRGRRRRVGAGARSPGARSTPRPAVGLAAAAGAARPPRRRDGRRRRRRARRADRRDRTWAGRESALSALPAGRRHHAVDRRPASGAGSAELAADRRPPGRGRPRRRSSSTSPTTSTCSSLDAAGRAARAAAYADLARRCGVHVRLGEMTRPDDGLLAWFVDDDFTRARLVDRVVRRPGPRGRPAIGATSRRGAQTPIDPGASIRSATRTSSPRTSSRCGAGVPRIVTLLMVARGARSTSPAAWCRARRRRSRGRGSPRAWTRLVPSIRVGPVLVDPGDVRLPTRRRARRATRR